MTTEDTSLPAPDDTGAEGGRERRGRRVREIWVTWASEQPDPKPSHLTGWDELGDGDREVDMRIGDGVAGDERAAWEARIRKLGAELHGRKWQYASEDARFDVLHRAGNDVLALLETDPS